MELRKLCDEVLKIFQIENIGQLGDALMNCINVGDCEKYKEFVDLVSDLSVDWLQKIFQYYEADRKIKKQDYTPKSLATMVAKLSHSENETVCLDMCAGSGALTIQKWNENPNIEFVCEEFDENVIPFLLFNLVIRNINATVLHCDVLQNEIFKAYKITKSSEFSKVSEIESPPKIKVDTCITNPPYNLKWELPVFAQMQDRFSVCGIVPPASNANYAFALTALDKADRVTMIMPCTFLTPNTTAEKIIVDYLVSNNLIDSIIINPDNMFESTAISTCLVTFSKKRKTQKIATIDARQKFTIEKREQNGQYGVSNTKRTYVKEIKTYSLQQQDAILSAIENMSDEVGFCKCVNVGTIKNNKNSLKVTDYIEFDYSDVTKHRSYDDIVNDLNRIIAEKNCCKLIINETVAKSLGIYDIFELRHQTEDIAEGDFGKFVEKISNVKLVKSDYIRLTKNKNEFSFCNNSKDNISSILMMIMQMWKQHIYYLNNQENIYLAELRDALLPELMSGKLKV